MLARRGIATPMPSRIYRAGESAAAFDRPVAVKAQTLSGKRAEAGLIKLAEGARVPELVAGISGAMQAMGQTPIVLVEAQADIAFEYYLAWRIDDLSQRYVMMFSRDGGSDIEERGDSIRQYFHSPMADLQPYHLAPTLAGAGLPPEQIGPVARFALSLFEAFRAEDAALLEINPLVVTKRGGVMAVDAKLVLDDNSDKRHKNRAAMISATLQAGERTELEAVAAAADFTFVELAGPVAVYSAGAGMGMCLLDMLAEAGIPAANFSDASGGSGAETFARMGQVVFQLAERDDVKAIVFFFVLAATSLKSVVDGILHLIDTTVPPKPLVIGLIAAGAAERELTLADAQALIRNRGYQSVTELADAVAVAGELVRTGQGGLGS